MPKQEYPLTYLENYLPPLSGPPVLALLERYKVHLTITKERKTVLGDYRHAHNNAHHRISVNGNLNKYAFLITLIHELAHLVTFMEFGNRVQAHGREWKHVYKVLLLPFLAQPIFPANVQAALRSSLHDMPASSCADEGLMRVLRGYDKIQDGMVMVEELAEDALFSIDNGSVFKRGKRLRKRFQCVEVKTGRLYLFSPVYEVKKIS